MKNIYKLVFGSLLVTGCLPFMKNTNISKQEIKTVKNANIQTEYQTEIYSASQFYADKYNKKLGTPISISAFSTNYVATIYEYKDSVKNTDLEYLGFAVTQCNDVDIEFTISDTEYYSYSTQVSGGIEFSMSAGFKIFNCGATVNASLGVDLSSTWESGTSTSKEVTFLISRDDEEGTYYLYNQKYTADYVIEFYNQDEGESSFVLVKNAEGIRTRRTFLKTAPKLLTPLAYKC